MGRHVGLVAGDRLVSRVFHDAKQPLNVIRTIAQELALDVRRARLDAGSVPERMREVVAAVDVLTRQLDQLRAFACRLRPAAEPDAVDVVDACLLAARSVPRACGHAVVTVDFGPQLPRAAAGSVAVRRAIEELLDNAVRAAEQAGREPSIRIGVRAEDDRVTVTVADNGAGVEAENLARIFDPFFSTRVEAAGLGLAIASSLAADWGGWLTVDAPGSDGTRFTLSLPQAPPRGMHENAREADRTRRSK